MDIAVQLYTVRKDAKKDLPGTLSRLKTMGFTRVELARIDFNEENAKIVKDSGMEVTSVQVKPKVLDKDFDRIVTFCRATGCRRVVASVLPLEGIFGGTRGFQKVATRLSLLAIRYEKAGIRFAFHHHDFEFRKIQSVTKLKRLTEWTDPPLHIVMDTYWVKKSGRDPLQWYRFLDNRLEGLHLRDCRPGKHPSDCELGTGIIDFSALFSEPAPRTLYGAVEQNSRHPWESLQTSITYLKSLNHLNVHI